MTSISTLQLLRLAGLGALMAAAAAPALAQDSYFYGGLSAGQSRAKIDEDRITATLLGSGLATSGMDRDERGNAFKLFGGYQFNRYLGVEAGYFNLGRFGFSTTTVPAGTLDGQIKLQGLNLDLVGTLPVTEKWSLLGRVGVQHSQAKDRFAGTGAVAVLNPNPSQRDTNAKVGLGLQYAFSPNLLVRGEAERYRINDAVGNRGDVNVYSLSLVFPFGRAPTTVARAPAAMVAPMMAAAPMPAAPPPPVVVVVPPPPAAPVVVAAAPAPRRVSFSADSVFTFDRADLRPDGKAALDKLARELRDTRFDVVTVEGHTDRLGSAAYNQKLSERRAEAVKSYLVTPGGVDATKIAAVGKSESMPVTQPGDCKGERATPSLVACLQPDRRVVVEVAGTR